MMGKSYTRTALTGCVFAIAALASRPLAAATSDTPITREQFLELQQENRQMQQQLQNQQRLIESLNDKVSKLASQPSTPPTNAVAATAPEDSAPSDNSSPFHIGKVDITGEGGVAYFKSGSKGQFSNGPFRIDEARVFLDAPVWGDVYFFSELDLATRETTSLVLNVGELYLDFEDVSKLWDRERMLNLRVGRFYIPFGEEYANRFAIDNPLISHSVSDIWGSDDGVEVYGKVGMFRYAAAVQNGGGVTSQSLQGDKSVAGRISADPATWLHLSASAMRTGELNVANGTSAIWFGNGWFRSIGSPGTTAYHANLVEADAQIRLPFAQIKGAGGYVDYNDNDSTTDNHRDVYYYYVEGSHDWTHNLYSAVRWSQVLVHKGFPIVGNGNVSTFGFGELTKDYWRLSLGLGYRFSPNLVVKGEYSLNGGREVDGDSRNRENQFALEAAFKF